MKLSVNTCIAAACLTLLVASVQAGADRKKTCLVLNKASSFIDLTNTANTTFYLELEKIYGGVMLQYNLKDSVNENAVVDKIWNKI